MKNIILASIISGLSAFVGIGFMTLTNFAIYSFVIIGLICISVTVLGLIKLK